MSRKFCAIIISSDKNVNKEIYFCFKNEQFVDLPRFNYNTNEVSFEQPIPLAVDFLTEEVFYHNKQERFISL